MITFLMLYWDVFLLTVYFIVRGDPLFLDRFMLVLPWVVALNLSVIVYGVLKHYWSRRYE